ncbi:MAG: hypothetical protein KGQ59_02710 [Bdellovibrionales bacterium]|nr:hypothetical protein [Bdellovibrionales bacterium]
MSSALILVWSAMLGVIPLAHASPQAEDLQYESTECDAALLNQSEVRSELESIREIFESAGLGGANPEFGSGKDFHGVDEVFTPAELGPMAFLKLCLKPKSSDFTQNVIATEEGYLFHGQTPSKLPYAIYFTGIDKEGVKKFADSLNSIGKTASFQVLDFFIPSAYAGKNEILTNSRKPKRDPSSKGSHRDILAATASCGVGLGKGVLAATVVPVVGIVKTTVRFIEGVAFAVRKPAEAWNRIVKRVKDLSGVIKGFSLSKTLRGAKGAFRDLPFGKKVEVVCAVVSAIGTSAALSLFIAPLAPANIVMLVNILSAAGMLDTVKDYLIPPEKELPDQPVSNKLNKLIQSLQNIGKTGSPAGSKCNP